MAEPSEESKVVINLPPDVVSKAEEAFRMFSKERDGFVMVKDLPLMFEMLGRSLSEAEVNVMVEGMAKEPEEGEVFGKRLTYPVFLQLLVDKFNDFLLRDELLEAFRIFDPQRKGFIPVVQFRYILRTYGERYSMEDAEELIKECEPEDEQIKYEKFIDKMLKQLGIV